ncbi:MAG: shikimate dehydrogenase [Crocinitomicaceae bacterium]|jgi:shikimate dehydrogenase|nr:shikimate dehydrogenase [Crocinitomicaceae bacterium]
MKTYGLIGKSLGHSFSPGFFKSFFEEHGIEAQYKLIELDSIERAKPILDGAYHGLNVTIPYKEEIIPFLDELSPEATAIGAVNTIVFSEGKAIGFNTDAFGFQQSIKPFLTFEHERALILGTGGSSKAVGYVLRNLGIQVNFLSRNEPGGQQFSYEHVNEAMLSACKLIVNCTPVGMFPAIDACPLPSFQGIGPSHLVVDLIYNPEETLLLKEAKSRGAATLNGLPMLKAQALKSWELWNQFD